MQIVKKISSLVKNNKQLDFNEFSHLALELFEYQFNTNPFYQEYCKQLNKTPQTVASLVDIPFIPTRFFKNIDILNKDKKACQVFYTSGTTDPSKKGRIYRDKESLDLMYLGFTKALGKYLNFESEKDRMVVLAYPGLPKDIKALFDIAFKNLRISQKKIIYLTSTNSSLEETVYILKRAVVTKEPICLITISPFLYSLMRVIKKRKLNLKLPKSSLVADGGDYRHNKKMTKQRWIKLVTQIFRIPAYRYVNIYGLTETNSEFFDNVYFNHLIGKKGSRYKPHLPWTRTIAVDPKTLEPLPKGKKGFLRHYDLLNLSHALAIQTDDLGYEIENGFEVIGKIKNAEAKICSYVTQKLLSNLYGKNKQKS